MKKQRAAPVFKPYVMNQMSLMPQSYAEKIPPGHLVRQVDQAVEKLELGILLEQYEGGGTSSYHPKMMLKVLIYAYCKKIYTSRKIAEALEENIYFMWLSGGNTPDFRTINEFRGKRMKEVIEDVFSGVVEQLIAGVRDKFFLRRQEIVNAIQQPIRYAGVGQYSVFTRPARWQKIQMQASSVPHSAPLH
jgi:transposase